jgi:hypothetical protein
MAYLRRFLSSLCGSQLMIFHNCHTMTQAFKELEDEEMKLTPE